MHYARAHTYPLGMADLRDAPRQTFGQFGMDRRKVLLLVGSLAFVMLGIVVWRATMSPTASSGVPARDDGPPADSLGRGRGHAYWRD